jgi:uncharacterized protein (TIGR03435 family)
MVGPVRLDYRVGDGSQGRLVNAMAKRAAVMARAVLLIGVVCLADAASAWAQAGVEAGALGAAASSAAGAAGRATGQTLRSVIGKTGAKVDAAAAGTAVPPKDAGAPDGAAPKDAAPNGAAEKTPSAEATDTMPAFTANPLSDDGTASAPPQIHFDEVSFQRCNGGVASTKVDLPVNGDSIAFHCQPVFRILYYAFSGMTSFKLTLAGYPDWVETDLYNFEARVAPEDVAAWKSMSLNARRAAVRGLLTDALKLKIKVNTAPQAVYTLQVADDGAKLKAYTEGEQQRLPNGLLLNGRDMSWVGRVAYLQDASMTNLADLLTAHLDREVLDLTGLAGGYDFALPLPYGTGTSANADLGENIPSVARQLSELGLRLEAGKAEAGGLIVQHIERPAED